MGTNAAGELDVEVPAGWLADEEPEVLEPAATTVVPVPVPVPDGVAELVPDGVAELVPDAVAELVPDAVAELVSNGVAELVLAGVAVPDGEAVGAPADVDVGMAVAVPWRSARDPDGPDADAAAGREGLTGPAPTVSPVVRVRAITPKRAVPLSSRDDRNLPSQRIGLLRRALWADRRKTVGLPVGGPADCG